MYIQITTKCNMQCRHCMYSCKPGKGKHMPMEIFRQAVDLAMSYESGVAIGGGEPTLHPDILMMLGYASLLSNDEYMTPFMVTNGTCSKELWNVLVRAFRMKNLQLHVSNDPWHDMDMIPEYIWDDCDEHKLWWGEVSPRHRSTRTIEPKGRARLHMKRLQDDAMDAGYDDFRVDKDGCREVRVDPRGIVWVDAHKFIKVGPLSEDTVAQAHEIISRLDDDE